MKQLTIKEYETIEAELQAFNDNFEEVTVYKNGGYYFVCPTKLLDDSTGYVYHAQNIYAIKGWLYGCIQSRYNAKIRPL